MCLDGDLAVMFLFFPFYFFDSTGIWTQSLELVKQALYHLSHTPGPFCFSCFLNRDSNFGQADLDYDPSSYTSHIVGITGKCFHTQLLLVEIGSY
jgi:hypothetical protein